MYIGLTMIKRLLIILALLLLFASAGWGLEKIPDLIGFGTTTRGEYGGSNDPVICIVDDLTTNNGTLADSTRNGTSVKVGSLRECINYTPAANTGKVILFEVSGTITGDDPYLYDIEDQWTGIYGQTAPSPGITLKNLTFRVQTSDVVIQHLRFRMGDEPGYTPLYRDAFGVIVSTETVANVIIDHCSISWGVDETFSIYDNGTGSISNVTVSNSIISEGLDEGIHGENNDLGHSKGLMVGGANGSPTNVALLRNLLSSNVDRNSYIQSANNVVIANNIAYNVNYPIEIMSISNTIAISLVNNAAIGYLYTRPKSYFLTLFDRSSGFWANGVGSEIYTIGNRAGEYSGASISWNEIQASASDLDGVEDDDGLIAQCSGCMVTSAPIEISGASYLGSDVLVSTLASTLGARPANRDTVDTRIILELQTGAGEIVDTISYTNADCVAENVGPDGDLACCTGSGTGTCNQNAEAGWPTLAENGPTDLSIPSSPHVDAGSGYTYLEVWLQGLADIVEGTAALYPIQGAAGNFKYK